MTEAIELEQIKDVVIPFPEDLEFLLTEPARFKILYGGRGGAKCLGLGTKIIMFDGSLCAVENVRVGDWLMGPDNKPRKVLGTSRGVSELYRVKQTSGIDYVVNSAHILSLKDNVGNIHNRNVEAVYDEASEKDVLLRGWKYNSDILSRIKIEPIGVGEYAGFTLDGDHLFLLEDGTVTHNTESIGLALIILSRLKTLRIACFREIQKSISESVYATIENRIRDLGIAEEFDFVDKEIRHKITGSVFIFYGLRYNINSIKSLARIDIAWVEEAVNVSKTSWDKLEPTIRGKHIDDPTGMGGPFGEGPEIWASFNPELDSDHTYERFILHRDKYAPDFIEEDGRQVRYAYVKKINLEDNPFAPRDLIRQATLLKEKDELEYMHVYGGHTKQVLDGAIYAEEIKQVLHDGRRGKVEYDPSRTVHTFWDLGHSDQTAIWFVQQVGMHYNLIDYFQDSLKKLPYYVEQLQDRKYNYGFHYLPHDGDNETLAARSPARILRDTYPGKVKIVPRIPKKIVGIRAARVVFELCNFDELKTAEGWTCLCKYQYAVDENGKMSKDPLHNEYSNGADAYQTFALSLKSETATKAKTTSDAVSKIINIRPGINSWMGT